jgi:hypothetical protein
MTQIEEDFCVICYEPGDFVKSQPCECKGTLQFHSKCLDELKKHTHMCPTCKTEFKLPDGPAVLKIHDNTMYVTIVNGKWHGPVNVLNAMFARQTEFYEHGKSTGRINYYHSNGRISAAKTVDNYDKVGPSIKYYGDGSVRKMSYYKNGLLCYAYKYANNGKLMSSFHIRRSDDGRISHIDDWEHPIMKVYNFINKVCDTSIIISLNLKYGLKIRIF